jgi:hypothetical protein
MREIGPYATLVDDEGYPRPESLDEGVALYPDEPCCDVSLLTQYGLWGHGQFRFASEGWYIRTDMPYFPLVLAWGIRPGATDDERTVYAADYSVPRVSESAFADHEYAIRYGRGRYSGGAMHYRAADRCALCADDSALRRAIALEQQTRQKYGLPSIYAPDTVG